MDIDVSKKIKLSLRVNELFHDIEQEDYDEKHSDILVGEAMRWKKNTYSFFKNRSSSTTFLDIGSGTGFVLSLIHI